jgi:hypothetical protein
MTKKQLMQLRLRNAIYRPNAWVLTQGYLWVKKYLYYPVMYLKDSILRRQKVKQLEMLYDACTILSDVNCILGAYKTAYRWISLAYKIDSSTDELVEDIIFIAQVSGITKNIKRYTKQYLALCSHHNESNLSLGLEADDESTLLLLDKLNLFRPKEVIEAITDESDTNLRLIKTMAYGAAQDIDVFLKRFQRHIEAREEIGIRHLYYCPLAVLDSPHFWKKIIKYKPKFTTMSCDLRTLISNSKLPPENDLLKPTNYEDMPPFLHLARTEQDIGEMESLAHRYPTWKDPASCVRFFMSHEAMPKWKEFYCLEDLDPKRFLTNERPKRFCS